MLLILTLVQLLVGLCTVACKKAGLVFEIFSVRPHAYALCLKSDNRPIGAIELKMGEHTDLTEKDDECELGYWIGKPFWGQGLIPEAARVMLRFAFEILV